MNSKDRAKKKLREALLKTQTAKKAKKGIENKVKKTAKKLNLEKLGEAAAIVRTIASGKIKAKKKLSKDSSISGELDVKNKSVKVNYNKSF